MAAFGLAVGAAGAFALTWMMTAMLFEVRLPGTPPANNTMPMYSWRKKSTVYHYSNCRFVSNIAPANLVQGNAPPEGKTLHQGCPK